MQQFLLKLTGLTLLISALLFTGCGTDDPVVDPIGPDLRLESGAGLISEETDLVPGTPFTVRVTADAGDTRLRDLRIQEDGTNLPTANFDVEGGAITSQNPLLIVTDVDGFSYDILITPTTDEQGTVEYTFRVTDENNLSDEVSLTINYVGTPIEQTITGALLNQAGPAGQGGIDLDNGQSVGSQSAAAEIQDEGIDLALQPANNWRRQISSVNGTEIRTPDRGRLPEGFSFDNITLKDQIIEAYNTGLALQGADNAAEPSDVETETEVVSEPVEAGNLFIVKKGEQYYIVRIDAVNVTTNNNNDRYELSIKY